MSVLFTAPYKMPFLQGCVISVTPWAELPISPKLSHEGTLISDTEIGVKHLRLEHIKSDLIQH